MNLYDYINNPEVSKAYGEYQTSGELNFATYWNPLYPNIFKQKDKQKNYLYNGDVNFTPSATNYVNSLTHQYDYARRDVDASTTYVLFATNSDGYLLVSANRQYLSNNYTYKNVVSVYRYLWFDEHDSNLVVALPNQGNWNINIYVNDSGELIIDTDNE